MSDLLELVLEAHGGLDAWKRVKTVDVRMSLAGFLFEIKQHPNGLKNALVKVDAGRPRTLIAPFPTIGKRGIYQDGKVWIQDDVGLIVEELPYPRTAYEGHERYTPWNDLQFLYFIGYAFWNYFTMPFMLTDDGIAIREVEPWEENGQKWRVIEAEFDKSIDVHCAVQRFYFNSAGLLVRNDYFTDVAKGHVAHYTTDHKTFDGIVFPTRRRVVSRADNNVTNTAGPSSVLIDIETVVLNTD